MKFSKTYSCSQPISAAMPLWPDDPPIQFTPWADFDEAGFLLRAFCMGEHSGTHVNAPSSFLRGGRDMSHVAASPLVFPLVVMDISAKATACAGAMLELEDIHAWEGRHGIIPEGAFVAVHTGWDAYWTEPRKFLGVQAGGSMMFPSISYAAVEMLISERGASGVGIDTHGVDSPAEDVFRCNSFVLAHGGVVVECLCNLGVLPAKGATVVIGALQLAGGSGSPAAVTVLV
ncbi:cyclase family protein [Oleidesulfovibrio sp.]|uniref:cyclase family protein n=1 Tax=Oleidesulfovibrio sp. TaxID=2909707 RepID=UPI003A83A20C